MSHSEADRRLFAQAQQAMLRDDLGKARELLETLLQSYPGDAQLCMMLAGILMGQGHLRAATECLLQSVSRLPGNPEMLSRMARYMHEVGEINGARDSLQRPVDHDKRNAAGLASMGMVWQVMGVPDKALELMDQAAALGFDIAEQHYFRGLQLMFLGRYDEARAAWLRCLDKAAGFGRASLSHVRSQAQTLEDNLLERVARAIQSAQPGSVDHAAAEFARFKVLDDLGQSDDAWTALDRGNAIMAQRLRHDQVHAGQLIDEIITHCPADLIRAEHMQHSEGPQPIFVVGMPRSGTTLFERILSNHSMVTSAGELNDFWRQLRWMADLHGNRIIDVPLLQRCHEVDFAELGKRYLAQTQWRAGDNPYYVDKLPSNCHIAGLIHRALPDAPILHMVREPMDVCYSNFKAMFGEVFSYSYNQQHLGGYYQQYRRLMDYWHEAMPGAILDVPYVDLLNDAESMLCRVLDFCGLPFEEGCLDLARNTSPVTSLSSPQVRAGIHRRALGEWQRYARQLEPLRQSICL